MKGGGFEIEPVVRDLRTSNWGFDTKTRCLFPGDGFAYSHYHWDGHCGMVAEDEAARSWRPKVLCREGDKDGENNTRLRR